MKLTDKKLEIEKELSGISVDTGISSSSIFEGLGKFINLIIELLKFFWDITLEVLKELWNAGMLIITKRGKL